MNQMKTPRAVTPDRILEQLRKDIITGRYRRGDKIVETELAEAFGASRGSVRSALQALEGEGMTRKLANGRTEVTGFTKKEAHDMYELRWLLENRAAEIVARREAMLFTPLLEIITIIEESTRRMSEDTDWYDLDLRFHRALVEAAGNAPLLNAWELNRPTMYALLELNTSIDYRERYIAEFLPKHRRLFELFITGDPEIYPLLKEHIMDALVISENVMERLGNPGGHA